MFDKVFGPDEDVTDYRARHEGVGQVCCKMECDTHLVDEKADLFDTLCDHRKELVLWKRPSEGGVEAVVCPASAEYDFEFVRRTYLPTHL